ncbi:MAG: TRAP transporter substrate-binding protein [Firmicutes bacterium]|nr:TRAP transporter substrate-binding protein [Bacillota bacterium]
MKVKKRGLMAILIALILLTTVLTGCDSKTDTNDANQNADKEKSMVFKLANVSAVGDTRDQICHKFAELVEQKTSGKVKVEVYSGGTLGDWRDTIEGLEPGIVQVVMESIGTIEAYASLANIDAVPFLYRDEDHFQKVWYSEIGQELLDKIGDQGGFKLIGPSHRGARYVTSKKKIESAEDVKGLKIRVPPIAVYLKTWEMLGSTPTPMAFTEVYTGLQQGTVDAQENPLSLSYSSAFYEVCPYLIETKHVYSSDLFIFNKEFFEGLPEDIQKAVSEAATEAGKWGTQLILTQEEDFIEKFKEKGVEVIKPDISSFEEKVKDIVDKEFPELKEIADAIRAVK